jgi:hypothetical protein
MHSEGKPLQDILLFLSSRELDVKFGGKHANDLAVFAILASRKLPASQRIVDMTRWNEDDG